MTNSAAFPRRGPFCLAILAALAASACNDPPSAPEPGSLLPIQGPAPVGVPGWNLIDTLAVQVVGPGGNPREGITVTWAVTVGGGSITPLADSTDAAGLARAVWTLGPMAGSNEVKASTVNDGELRFQSTGEAFRVDLVAGGLQMACGLLQGAIWCLGKNSWVASLAVSDPNRLAWDPKSPGLVDGTHAFVSLAVAGSSVCGLEASGTVRCAHSDDPQGSAVAGLPPMARIAGANWGILGYTCGLALADSTAWCWSRLNPAAPVPGSPAFVTLALEGQPGGSFTDELYACGLRADSTAACWGAGPLGDGGSDSSSTPVVVSGGHRFVELGVGRHFACGRKPNGEVWCWGADWAERLRVTGG